MDSLRRFDETLLPNEENFYSTLNMEDITDVDYRHAKYIIMIFTSNVIHYYLQMYLKTFEMNVLKYMNLIQLIF